MLKCLIKILYKCLVKTKQKEYVINHFKDCRTKIQLTAITAAATETEETSNNKISVTSRCSGLSVYHLSTM